MQWFELDPDRLEIEILLMERNGVNFRLYQDKSGNLLWRGALCVRGHLHNDVRLIYTSIFPLEPIIVYILDPKLPPCEHVSLDGRICYCRSDEWNPDWTALAVYLTTIRFLDEYYSGKMFERHNESDSLNLPTQDDLFRKILGVLEALRE